MAAFSLWQLLNQRQPFDSSDDSDPAQQQQAAGQAIGQSLVDLWNRADADAAAPGSDDADPNPYLNHLVYFPPPPGTPPIQPQLLPFVPRDQFGVGSGPVERLLAAATDWGDPRSDAGEGGIGAVDPNIRLAQGKAISDVLRYGPAVAAAAAEWLRQQLAKRQTPLPSPVPPPPPIDSQTIPPVPPFSVPDESTPSGGTPDGTGNPSASPSLPRTIGDFTVGSESPFEDSDFLPRFDVATPEPMMSVRGDYSNGRHDPFVNFQIDSLRKAGCNVEPKMGLGSLDDPRIAIADWMHQCFDNTVPTVGEGKTGRWGRFTTNQNVVYPAVAAGRGYSTSPRIARFGFEPYSQLPPLPVMRSWSPWHGAPVMDDFPFDGAP